MQLKQITYFLSLAKELNFSQAARRLGIGQPVLSRKIKELESYLDVELFKRTTTSVTLTEAGKAFLPKVDEAMLLLDEAVLEARSIDRHSGDSFNIGYLPSSLLRFLGQTLDLFSQTFPQANVQAFEMPPARQIEALRSGKIDIAFVGYVCQGIEKEFDLFDIYQRPICLVTSKRHPILQSQETDLKRLNESELITLSSETFPGRQRYIFDLCEKANVQYKNTCEVDNLMNALALIATKNAFSFMPEELQEVAPQQVSFTPMNSQLGKHKFTALVQKSEARKSIRTFLEECRNSAQNHIAPK